MWYRNLCRETLKASSGLALTFEWSGDQKIAVGSLSAARSYDVVALFARSEVRRQASLALADLFHYRPLDV